MMQRIESTTVWRREKMQSDCVTAENKKPSGVRRQRRLLQVAPLNIEDGMHKVSHPKTFQRQRDRHQVKLTRAFDRCGR
jgi:hypothetical protein